MALCASFKRIREFVLSHTLLFCNNGGEVDGSGATQDAVFLVLRAHPNLNPMGASRRRRREQGGGGQWQQRWQRQSDTAVHCGSNPAPESLYPCVGHCHAFLAGPDRAAVLDALLPPYGDYDDRACTYYKRRAIIAEDNAGDGKQR